VSAGGNEAAYAFLASFDSNMTGTYTQKGDRASSDLVMQATTDGDLAVDLKIELASTRTVPTPDAEEGEAGEGTASDDETSEARVQSKVTRNSVQLMDPRSHAVLCDGKLTSFDENYARMTCTGAGPYAGVRIDLQTRFDASRDGTFSGGVSGEMSHTS
jgi:hypothetical protein